MNDYEIQKIRDTAFCSGYNTAVSKYEKQNKELQKENAELKEKVKNLQKYLDTQNCYRECAETWLKLTKAKELLERFLGLGNLWDLDCKDYLPLRKEAEQFLKEVEK